MRVAGAITGLLVLGTFVIPSSYELKQDSISRGAWGTGPAIEQTGATETGSALIAGRVYDPAGRPLEGVTVSLAGSGFWPARSVQTGTDGRFHWPGVPAGIYELRASKGRLACPPLEGLILDPGARRVFGLRLAEGWTLSGQVIDEHTGRAIPGANITMATGVLGVYSRRVQADEQGKFVLTGVIGDDHSLYVEADGYVAAGPLRAASEDQALDVRLELGARIEGWVVDERGRPVEGAIVRAYGGDAASAAPAASMDTLGVTAGPVPPISAAASGQLAFIGQVASDVDGGFRLPNLRPGSYTVIASHSAYAPGESREIRLRRGATASDVRVVMVPGADLRGRVVDSRGDGLEGIPIELRIPRERLPRMAVSREDGSFAFRGVRGEVTVTAVPYNLPPARKTLTIESDRRTYVELVLSSALLTLRGRVVDENGFGIEGAVLTVSSVRPGTPIERSAKSEPDGTFAVPALPEPPFNVQVEHPAFSSTRLEQVEDTDDVQVVLATGVTLQGRVLDDWSGEALAGASVRLNGPMDRSIRTRPDGSFVFRQAPVGVYDLTLSHPDYEEQIRRVVLERPLYVDRPQEIDTIRLHPGGIIEGEVLDAYGEPVPGAEVTWGEPPDWERATRSNTRGEFQLRGVPPGWVWVTARHPDAGEALSAEPITVRPQETSPGAYVRLPERLDLVE